MIIKAKHILGRKLSKQKNKQTYKQNSPEEHQDKCSKLNPASYLCCFLKLKGNYNGISL